MEMNFVILDAFDNYMDEVIKIRIFKKI
jgi:hypothetical protein